MKLIDTHTHLDAEDFDSDRESVITRAQQAGVFRMITIGSGYGAESAPKAIAIAESHPHIYAAVGIHPNDASMTYDINVLSKLAKHPKVVAIGETGLDFYRDHASPQVQEQWFRGQIQLAIECNKPLIIHSRSAGEACLKVLLEEGAQKVGGVFHCFSEDANFAERLREINFIISIAGNVTFKKAEQLRQAVRATPLTRIMLETDAPFLAPHPYRGQRCESSYIVETASMIAEIKGVSLDEVATQTSQNALSLFKID